MGIEKYRIKTHPSFDKYYDLFLRNVPKGKYFKITSTDGDSIIGIPTACLMVKPDDPDVSFKLKTDSGDMYEIPYRVLEEVEAVDE